MSFQSDRFEMTSVWKKGLPCIFFEKHPSDFLKIIYNKNYE